MSNNLVIRLLLAVLVQWFTTVAVAQVIPENESTTQAGDLKLPSLLDCIDSAIHHSAVIKYRNLDAQAKSAAIETEKHYWTRNLSVKADAKYGNYPYFSADGSGSSLAITTVNINRINYDAGLSLSLPIADLLDRKNQIKRANTEFEEAKYIALAQEDELRQLVIKEYQEVLLKQRLLHVKSENLSTARANMQMVEKEFRNGTTTVTEYARILDIADRIEADYETAKSEFTTAKMILEDLVGFKFYFTDSGK